MLTWDEEVKPSLPKDMQQGLQHHNASTSGLPAGRSVDAPTSSIAQPALRALDDGAVVRPVAAAAATPAVTQRVKASDKRIINGQTDVNQLVPFKYKWAWKNTSPPAPTTGCRRK